MDKEELSKYLAKLGAKAEKASARRSAKNNASNAPAKSRQGSKGQERRAGMNTRVQRGMSGKLAVFGGSVPRYAG